MPSFPVFKLPDIPVIRIFELIDHESLFTLSFASIKARKMVKKCTSLLNPRISVSIDDNVYACRGKAYTHWNFYNKRSPAAQDVNFEGAPNWLISGVNFKFGSSDISQRVCVSENPINELIVFTDYLMDILSAELKLLSLDLQKMKDPEVILSVDWFRRCKHLKVKGFLNGDFFEKVLDEFKTERLELWCTTSEGFVYEKPFIMDTFINYNAVFFNRHNLLTMDCRQVSLSNNCLISSDINEFLRQWLANGHKRLEYLCISHFPRADLSVMIEGIETIEGSPKKPGCTTFEACSAPRFEEGRDIRRPCDGKWATVLVEPNSFFLFVVWQDPNPFL